MAEKYNVIKRIPSFDVDMLQRLKPASFLNYAQEAANIHADTIGVGYDSMQITKKAWVLARMHVVFHEMPRWRDNINLQSWHKGGNGLLFFRDFVAYDSCGNKIISATSSWLVIDIETRRLTKNSEFEQNDDTCIREDVIVEPADKLAMPKGVQPLHVMTHSVNYSDLDMNGHVNNVKYTEWAMNVIELDVTNRLPLRDLLVNFNNEIKVGDVVELYRHKETTEDGSILYYIEGRVNDKSSFVARLLF